MAQPRLASRPPVACAACRGQYPDRDHIDFRSAIEGGPVDDRPRAPHIEWVVICENCIRTAFEFLPKQADQRENLGRALAAMTARAEAAENYASSLEDTLSKRPDVEAPREPRAPKRQKQRQRQKAAPAAANTQVVDARSEPAPVAQQPQVQRRPARKNRYGGDA